MEITTAAIEFVPQKKVPNFVGNKTHLVWNLNSDILHRVSIPDVRVDHM